MCLSLGIPKAEPETEACVQVVYLGGDSRGQETGTKEVIQRGESQHRDSLLSWPMLRGAGFILQNS